MEDLPRSRIIRLITGAGRYTSPPRIGATSASPQKVGLAQRCEVARKQRQLRVAPRAQSRRSLPSYLVHSLEVQQPAAASPDTAELTRLQRALWDAADPELLATMLRIGDAELTREGRVYLLVTLSRFAPNDALIEALEMLAWDNGNTK